MTTHDLAVIVVSTNEARWLTPCLRTVYEHAGPVSVDVVVADNQSTDGTRALVEEQFPHARVITCQNRGFGHANNRALMTCDARYVLFLNPDTEILDGTFAGLVERMDERPEVGVVGVRQLLPNGEIYPTIRRFSNALRTLGEAVGSARLPLGQRWLGEREARTAMYERDVACDWTVGSFMLVRREALESAGYFDERFFLFSEEKDLCYRIRQAGWEVRHWPYMTIVHHAGKRGVNAKMAAQLAFAKTQYASKHFSPAHRMAYVASLALFHLLRAGYMSRETEYARERRAAAMRALKTIVGREPPPFGPPPGSAVAPRDYVSE